MASILAIAALSSAAFFSVGLSLPSSGIDGGEGLRMQDAVLVAIDDLHRAGNNASAIRASGAKAVQNPHQDEGSDNDADVAAAPDEIRLLAEQRIHVIVGPLRSNVARAEESALARAHSVAITGTARGPSEPGTRVFKLSPSDRQLAAAAYAWMRRHWGERVCVLDDGTSKARHEAAAFRAVDPGARHASLGGSGIDRCVERADGVYVTALEGDPIFCTAATARRSPANALVQALALRGFDPASFAEAGKLWRAEPVPIRRTAEIDAVATRYHARAFVAATDQALRFYAATQIAARAAQAGGDPRAFLRSRGVATILGTVRFDDRGEVQAPAIVVSPAN